MDTNHTTDTMLPADDLAQLKYAKQLLENPGLAVKITNVLGTPIEKGLDRLPKSAKQKIISVTEMALKRSVDVALWSLKSHTQQDASNGWHKLAVATTGGVGGFFGMATLPVELPISTTIMMRSIADIARSEGENLNELDCKMACIAVFAMGGKQQSDDAVNSGYFAVRTALARSVAEAAEYALEKGMAEASAPAIIRLISQVAQRLGVQVSEKVVAQAVPLVGAAGGALINSLFINHFQEMAQGHFIVRRLERKYGSEQVKACYQQLAA